MCRQKINTKWVAWSPTGALTCNTDQCVDFAARTNGWTRYSEGLMPISKPFPARRPARVVTADAPRRRPRLTPLERQLKERDQLAQQLRKAAQNADRVVVSAPQRGGWSCDGCGNRFPSRVHPVDVAGELRCRSCL